jgi:hypothetical protein
LATTLPYPKNTPQTTKIRQRERERENQIQQLFKQKDLGKNFIEELEFEMGFKGPERCYKIEIVKRRIKDGHRRKKFTLAQGQSVNLRGKWLNNQLTLSAGFNCG